MVASSSSKLAPAQGQHRCYKTPKIQAETTQNTDTQSCPGEWGVPQSPVGRGKGVGPLQVGTPAQQGEKGENSYVSWEQRLSLAPIASTDSKERAIVQLTCERRPVQYTLKTSEKKLFAIQK